MITHYLKFADEAQAKAALAEFLTVDGDWQRDKVDGPIPIMRGTGQFASVEGEQVELRELIPGYHLNIALPEYRADLPGLIDAPETPQRVFA